MTSRSGSKLGPPLSVLVTLASACAPAPCPPVAPGPVAASSSHAPEPDAQLVGFARATCLAVYLEEKGGDSESARNIAGGYVELGTASAEAYEALAAFIRDFEPPLGSQQPIDLHLSRCFQIEHDGEWQQLVRAR